LQVDNRRLSYPTVAVNTRVAGEVFDSRECGFSPANRVAELQDGTQIPGSRRRSSASHKVLYAALVRFACKGSGADACAFPSLASLVNDTGQNLRALQMRLDDLEAFGLIARQLRAFAIRPVARWP
jgi:hypothetical protein